MLVACIVDVAVALAGMAVCVEVDVLLGITVFVMLATAVEVIVGTAVCVRVEVELGTTVLV